MKRENKLCKEAMKNKIRYKFVVTFLLVTQIFITCKKTDIDKPKSNIPLKTEQGIIIDGKFYISATFGARF